MKHQSIISEGTVESKWWMLRNDSSRKSNKCVKNARKINILYSSMAQGRICIPLPPPHLCHRPHNHHTTHWHWQCYVWQPYCQMMHRNGNWNYSKSHISVSVCWTLRFAPLLHSVPLVQTTCLRIQGKLVAIAGSCTSGFFGSNELDDTVTTRVHETFGMVILVHYHYSSMWYRFKLPI
jgi:hypothetical protein